MVGVDVEARQRMLLGELSFSATRYLATIIP
jgi:hypothetical protein